MLSTHKKAKCYAGGGLIESLFGASKKESVTEKFARQDAERAAKATKPAAAPAVAPAAPAAGTIAGYAGMSAMQRREKEAGLADGGPIKGPGTGTSDSIHREMADGTYIMPTDSTKKMGLGATKVPVRVSNGEHEITPEQVHKIGAAVLTAVKDATHKPIAKMGAKRGKQALATGGLVEDPNERAAFGVFPQLAGGKRTSYATDNALRSGVVATGPASFAPALTPAAPVGPAITADGPGTRMNAQQDPRSTVAALSAPVVPAPRAPAAPGATATAALPDPASPPPGGVIRRLGNSYSGTDIGPGATIDNARNPGAGVTTIPGGAVSGTPSVDASLAAARTAAADRGDFGAVRDSYAAQGQGFGGQPAGGMSADQLQRIAMSPAGTIGRTFARKQLLANQETETTRRGQDATAGIARERLSMDKQTAAGEQAARKGLIAAQSAYLNAKTPAEKEAAAETLRALQGKSEPTDKFTVVPEYDGNGVRIGTTVLDQSGKPVTAKAAQTMPAGLVVGAPTKQADGVYQAAGKTVTIKSGKVTEIK